MPEIALFPLQTVPLPQGILPLRIFEPRYLDLVKDCLKNNTGFGIVLIKEGEEAGKAAQFFPIGSLVHIIDWNQQPDGLLGIVVKSEKKFQVLSHNIASNQLITAQIDYLPQEQALEIPQEYQMLVDILQQILAQSQHSYDKPEYQDAAWVGHRLVEFLRLPLTLKQELISLQDPIMRLALLQQYFIDSEN